MSSQIFKQKFSAQILFDFLDKVCKNSRPYVLNKESFKIVQLEEDILNDFLNKLEPFYFSSKKHYIKEKMTINNLFTIIRQVCNYLKIEYTSKIQYFKSKYEIIYYIFKDETL